MPRNIAASKIGNGVISLLWQIPCHCIPDHDKFSSLSNKTVVAIFPNVCLWRRSYTQNWELLTLKNCYSIEPPSYASTAYVAASYGPRFFSTVRFVNLREFFWANQFTAPPGKKFPLRLCSNICPYWWSFARLILSHSEPKGEKPSKCATKLLGCVGGRILMPR